MYVLLILIRDRMIVQELSNAGLSCWTIIQDCIVISCSSAHY